MEEFLDILVALDVAAPRRVGVGEFVDEGDFGVTLKNRVEVHLPQGEAVIVDGSGGDSLKPCGKGLGLRPTVGLHVADDDIDPLPTPLEGVLKHRVGLPHAGGVAEVDRQPPHLLLSRTAGDGEQVFRERSHLLFTCHHASPPPRRSSARLSERTLT